MENLPDARYKFQITTSNFFLVNNLKEMIKSRILLALSFIMEQEILEKTIESLVGAYVYTNNLEELKDLEEEIYEIFTPSVRGYIFSTQSKIDWYEDPDDLMQEARLGIRQGLQKYKSGIINCEKAPPIAYLGTCFVNKIRDKLRTFNNQEVVFSDVSNEENSGPVDEWINPNAQSVYGDVDFKIDMELMIKALENEYGIDFIDVFILKFRVFQNCSSKDIQFLIKQEFNVDISVDNIDQKKSRLMAKIREYVQECWL